MRHQILASALLIAGAVSAPISAAYAAETTPIVVKTAWLRATPKGASVVGGYATIVNNGTLPDRLVGAALPGTTAGEIHSMSMDAGVMHMERLDKGFEIKPGATVTLSPGGFHLMFLKPDAQLKEGQTITGTLTFEKAGQIPVDFSVASMAAKTPPGAPSGAHDMKGMDMKGMHHMDGMDPM